MTDETMTRTFVKRLAHACNEWIKADKACQALDLKDDDLVESVMAKHDHNLSEAASEVMERI
jgi:hypothetical protein